MMLIGDTMRLMSTSGPKCSLVICAVTDLESIPRPEESRRRAGRLRAKHTSRSLEGFVEPMALAEHCGHACLRSVA